MKMITIMKILITGINGFVGAHLRKECLDRGHDVYGIDLASTDGHVLAADLSSPLTFGPFIKDTAPDAVIHLAASSRVDHDNYEELYRDNILGTVNLLSSAVRCRKAPRFLFISSSQVYGIVDEKDQPISEGCPVKPVNHYGASKAAGENIAAAFHRDQGLPLVIARPFNHTGKNQRDNFLVPKLVNAFMAKSAAITLGNTGVNRDFTDVRDVTRAYADLIERFPDGGTFNVASGKTVSIPDIIDLLEKITGHMPVIKNEPTLLRKNDITLARGDYGLIKKETGWEPHYTIEDTLRWMLEGS
jgi:GDP-6-deoxy-D-talose 4-dehydrogenase